jgi:hypothetical protein
VSELILPPGYTRTPTSDALALKRANDVAEVTENVDPYYSEMPKVRAAWAKLNGMFAFSGEEPWTERQLETAAANLFGEAGFKIRVDWMQAMDPETGEELPFKAPSIAFIGRVDREQERDHDRVKHEVVSGLADGQKGYIREDGTKHEDPIKKVII